MNGQRVLLIIVIMALCTYLPHMLTLPLFRKKIRNRFISSLLCYLPYGILAAMVFPKSFTSTASIISASRRFRPIAERAPPVALLACLTVFVSERILAFAGMI